MAKLDRKQWTRLGKAVEMALAVAEQDQVVYQQSVFLSDILINAVRNKLDEIGRKRESLPGAAYILAGLHLFHSLTDAAAPFDETERQARVAEAMDQLLRKAEQNEEGFVPAPVLSLEERSKKGRQKEKVTGQADSKPDS